MAKSLRPARLRKLCSETYQAASMLAYMSGSFDDPVVQRLLSSLQAVAKNQRPHHKSVLPFYPAHWQHKIATHRPLNLTIILPGAEPTSVISEPETNDREAMPDQDIAPAIVNQQAAQPQPAKPPKPAKKPKKPKKSKKPKPPRS